MKPQPEETADDIETADEIEHPLTSSLIFALQYHYANPPCFRTLLTSLLTYLLTILTTQLSLYRRLAHLSLISFLYVACDMYPPPFLRPIPRLRPIEWTHIFCQIVVFTTLQSYISTNRERMLWLEGNPRYAAAYLHDIQSENPYYRLLFGVDPRLMVGGWSVDPRLALMAAGIVWKAVALAWERAFGLIDQVMWSVLQRVVGLGPFGL